MGWDQPSLPAFLCFGMGSRMIRAYWYWRHLIYCCCVFALDINDKVEEEGRRAYTLEMYDICIKRWSWIFLLLRCGCRIIRLPFWNDCIKKACKLVIFVKGKTTFYYHPHGWEMRKGFGFVWSNDEVCVLSSLGLIKSRGGWLLWWIGMVCYCIHALYPLHSFWGVQLNLGFTRWDTFFWSTTANIPMIMAHAHRGFSGCCWKMHISYTLSLPLWMFIPCC